MTSIRLNQGAKYGTEFSTTNEQRYGGQLGKRTKKTQPFLAESSYPFMGKSASASRILLVRPAWYSMIRVK
jgi:hypothetical protein